MFKTLIRENDTRAGPIRLDKYQNVGGPFNLGSKITEPEEI